MKNGGRLAGRLPWGKACGSGLVLEAGKDFLIRFHHIAQECSEQDAPILTGALFTIDYGMKAGALDLEKEAILQNYRGRKNMGFTLDGLKITQRVYVFGQGDRESLSKRFAKDVCNPAIHNWTIA